MTTESSGEQSSSTDKRETGSQGSQKDIRVIVRGDDLGFCHSANLAFEKLHKEGILTSAELMVPPPWFKEATEIIRKIPGLDIGIHLTLTNEWKSYPWGPVLPFPETSSLVNDEGHFHSTVSSFLEADPNPEEIREELEAQIELALEKDLNVSHLSYHMEAAISTPELKDIVREIAQKYNFSLSEMVGEKFWDGELVPVYQVPPSKKKGELAKIFEGISPGLWLITVHPGLDTPEMRAMEDANPAGLQQIAKHRSAVTDALSSEKIERIIEKRKIKLVSYRDLKD